MRVPILLSVLLGFVPAAAAQTAKPASPATPRVEFTRMIAHMANYASDDYLKFVEEARPEVCQIGEYGAHFYSLVHTPQYGGYPFHFPVKGIAECGKWFEDRNAAIHKRGAKVVGHFDMTLVDGVPNSESDMGPLGFFKFYRDLWDEKELGPKPVADPETFLARKPDGSASKRENSRVRTLSECEMCLNNPNWRTVLKAWAKRGIERGLDGFIANYFYRHNCLCEHCQAKFRGYMGDRFTAEQMRDKFGIADIKTHKFTEIVGWHNPKESTPLRREMLRFSQVSTKEAFDEILVKYARSIKPDLLLAQWNHLGDLGQINSDERTMLPPDVWGRDESYLWYSTGASACYTDLANGHLGEGTLHARYIRGAFDDKPFTLGKYEHTRLRVAVSELAANGGAPMGLYTEFSQPDARRELVRYYRFMAANDEVYHANKPQSEVALLFPRSKVHASADVAAVDEFKKVGKKLLNEHVLFDVVPDDLLTPEKKAAYKIVIDPTSPQELPKGLSTFQCPATVRVSASQTAKGDEITLHFVNYNRVEPTKPKSAGGGIKDEKPIEVDEIAVDYVLPKGAVVNAVRFATPEGEKPVDVKFTMKDARLQFTAPKFLVYGIARLQLVAK